MVENTSTNPVIAEIPEGAVVTLITRYGLRITGTDDTTVAQADAGVVVLFTPLGTGKHAMNRKVYVLASEVVGFEIEYE